MLKDVYKIDCVTNTCRFLNGVLWTLISEKSDISPQNKEYLRGKMFDCISLLESIKTDIMEQEPQERSE